MSNRQDDALPELPEPGVSERNPYLNLGPMGPHGGKQVLHWYDADQMREHAQSAIASLQARLDAAERLLTDVRDGWRLNYSREWEGMNSVHPSLWFAVSAIEKHLGTEAA